ncbi:DUF3040 family protein [Tamaricihabitans halophyticus]|uniref:DUF3040 family protein n=1 Tax=Tamaricihabitans halophyticus TaxID=1262583 RepID=A0A4R2Q912_9PSEU|nr:DUF3040 domain-containing protein [Tamaricihabitans halophyticus]TCP45393.1 DUF3040 family protein [Tamaricihabitans halophyticus]
MPLSEHEQRMLEQIERALYAEDPKFASNVRGARMRRPARRRRMQGAIVFVVGIALLVVGVIIDFKPADIPVVSVLGFLIMFGGALLAVSAIRQGGEPEQEEGTDDGGGGKRKSSPPRKSSFSQRMEERFRRRFDGP